jgi:hypothetical protein
MKTNGIQLNFDHLRGSEGGNGGGLGGADAPRWAYTDRNDLQEQLARMNLGTRRRSTPAPGGWRPPHYGSSSSGRRTSRPATGSCSRGCTRRPTTDDSRWPMGRFVPVLAPDSRSHTPACVISNTDNTSPRRGDQPIPCASPSSTQAASFGHRPGHRPCASTRPGGRPGGLNARAARIG